MIYINKSEDKCVIVIIHIPIVDVKTNKQSFAYRIISYLEALIVRDRVA